MPCPPGAIKDDGPIGEGLADEVSALVTTARERGRRRALTAAGGLAILASVAVFACCHYSCSPWTSATANPVDLRSLIAAGHPEVDWISTAELAQLLDGRARAGGQPASEWLVLDVRSEAEFGTSHLRDAVRVDPGATDLGGIVSDATMAPSGASASNLSTDIVVYCSVGYRSAVLADRLRAMGFGSVRNLEGGIFAWANEGRPVYRSLASGAETPAHLVHPYDAVWAHFLEPGRQAPLVP